jgi:DNA-binding CsgD family transcriptional regulator
MSDEHFDGRNLLDELTANQREVLDLLIQHKTSKEIARDLGISPHTVDQRVQFARDKLGVRTRGEAAAVYRRLIETYEQSTYESSYLAEPAASLEMGEGPFRDRSHSDRVQPAPPPGAEADIQVVPELFEGRYGTLMRLGAIVVIAVFLVIFVLGGLAIFAQLSELMAV